MLKHLSHLDAKCGESQGRIQDEIENARLDLAKHGIKESSSAVALNYDTVVPDGQGIFEDCGSMLAGYLIVKESGG